MFYFKPNLMKYFFLPILLFCVSSFAQTERYMPDSQFVVDYWHISPTTELYVGASFFYTDPNDSIVVWLESSESDEIGNLYCMIPGYSDSAFFLFTNKQGNARVNITNTLQAAISPGTEIFFMYSRQSTSNRRYTGQNREGIDPENKQHYPLASFVARDFGVRPGFGHRWSVAGRIADYRNVLTDTIVFGFEDEGVKINPLLDSLVTADFDFNDVIFKVTGLHLNVEKYPDSIALIQENHTDTIRAGDTVFFRAEVWSDSASIKVRAPQYDSLVSWSFKGESIHGDTLLPGANPPNKKVLSRTAYKQFTVCTRIISPLSGDTLSACKQFTPRPGPVKQLSIELIADTSAPGFSFNHTIQISRIQVSSNTTSYNVYAVLRDSFGNFARMSNPTQWDTTSALPLALTPGICTVKSSTTVSGQGIIERASGSGNILVYASTDLNLVRYADSVIVNIASVSYDSIRISSGQTVPPFLNSLQISTDGCTTLVAVGKRVDNKKWEVISAVWSSQKFSNSVPTSQDTALVFCPTDTGNGYIDITYQNYLHHRIPATASPGVPNSIKLYFTDGRPLPYDTVITAGKKISLTGYIFDKRGVRLKEQALSDSIVWQILERQNVTADDSTGTVVSKGKFNLEYFPQHAYRVVLIRSSFGNLYDSSLIRVSPGVPYRVVIESHADPSRSLNIPAEITMIEIPDNHMQATVFAIVRDSMGNYIDSLRNGTWGSLDTIVTVQPGQFAYKGIIQKNVSVVSGLTRIFVNSGNFSDTATVSLLPYHYIDLEITTPDYVPLQLLTLSTNDDTSIITRGLRSDTALWKDVASDWYISDSLKCFPEPASGTFSYSFSPVKPGTGTIIAHLSGSDDLFDTIAVNFTIGKPLRAELIIITAYENLLAGDSISAVVKIYNRDGLVPGQYCFSSKNGHEIKYGDVLGYGSSGYYPVVVSSEGTSRVNVIPLLDSSLSECFNGGIDTIQFVLYNAQSSKDSLHRLVASFDTALAFSSTFRLKPAALSSLKLAHTLPCCPNTLTLRHLNDQVLVYSVGYDLYGNMRGSEQCQWSVNGTLHPLDDSVNISRVLYESDPLIVTDDESGEIVAHSMNNPLITDSLHIFILGPRSNVVSALTGDSDGNGLLDRISITFDRPVFLEPTLKLSDFIIDYRLTVFTVESLSISPDNLHLTLFLNEQKTTSMQTGWTPQLTFDNIDYTLLKAPDTISVITTDGAGPVIESIVKEIRDNNRKNDLITVTFSERVSGPNGTLFSILQLPEHVFNTWRKVSADSMLQLQLLSGITGFNGPLKSDQLFFNMTNGIELTNRNYFNIRTDHKDYRITDRYNNIPHVNNRKVNVQIQGTIVEEMRIFPNPGRATEIRERAGEFHLEHNPSATDWVAADQAGIVMQFQLKLPENIKSTVKGQVTIFDAVGNVVCSDPGVHCRWKNLVDDGPVITTPVTKTILPKEWTNDGTIYHYYIYWNCFAQNKNRVAPGIYKVVLKVTVETEGSKSKPVIYSGLIGIKP
jgi:hypothetical protein